MSLVISKVFTYDTDAGDYIQAVEAADAAAGQTGGLEPATRQAINNFVIGCKQDGIWNAIKASCILSGARTLNGALQPLVGTAPTNVGPFVTGDYVRKTGLIGNGSSKYINSNRNNNVDPQDNMHVSVYSSLAPTTGSFPQYFGVGDVAPGTTLCLENLSGGTILFRNRTPATGTITPGSPTGFIGTARSSSAQYTTRVRSATSLFVSASTGNFNANQVFFAQNTGSSIGNHSNARLAFYSIGESLDLALLDARVTALITAFGVAIP